MGQNNKSLFWLILVASLAFFVEIVVLIIASISMRASSIKALSLATEDAQVKAIDLVLETWQGWGLLLGGIFAGILGDKIGRLKLLYGSISLYSIATLLNGYLSPAWCNTYFYYALFLFLSGFSLAGQMLIYTLVSESMKAHKRGIGSIIIVALGILGCIASLVVFAKLSWDTLFKIGGFAGVVLLVWLYLNYKVMLHLNEHKIQIFNYGTK